MDALIIYLIIGAIWLFQVLTKKKLEAQRRQKPEKYEPAKERDIFDELKEVLEKRYQPPSEQEVILEKAEPVEEQQIDETEMIETEEISEPELEKPAPIQPQGKEVLLKKIFDNYRPEMVLPETQVETLPVPYFLNDLSNERLEEGIIFSTILGPPRSIQLFKELAGRNLRWRN